MRHRHVWSATTNRTETTVRTKTEYTPPPAARTRLPFDQVVRDQIGCVLTAVIGMLTVTWYSLGGHISEEEMEQEVRREVEEKAKRGKFFGLFKTKTA